MEDNDVVFTEDLYAEHLATIHNVKFTPREIDIIACLLSARRTSQMASILTIAPRTVTTHFRNIMLKLDCNSQEGIINFIERSHKLSILREYYSQLVVEKAFEKSLQEISKIRREATPLHLIVYWKNKNLKDALISRLKNDLRRAGFDAEVREHTFEQKIKDTDSVRQFLVLLVEKEDNPEVDQKSVGLSSIDLFETHNYCFAVFEIIKKLQPQVNFEKIFENFKMSYENMCCRSNKISSGVAHEETPGKMKGRTLLKTIQTFKVTNRSWGLVFLIICLCSVAFLTFKADRWTTYDKAGIHAQNKAQEKTDEQPVRSDLIIPTASSFLDRSELLNQIDNKFKSQNGIRTVALVGPGGSGKTTLARQYAHEQKASVIWEINAETLENLKLSFEELAHALAKTDKDKKVIKGLEEIKNSKEKDGKIFQFLKESLRTHPNWVLVFDNVEIFSDIHKQFPQDSATWGEGKIILTTRDHNIQNNPHVNDIIQIDELTPTQKLNLFTKIINHGNPHPLTSEQKELASTFLKSIPSFPLDVALSAYYVKATNVPYNEYLENMAQCDKDILNVQESLLKEAGDYTKTRYSIITLSLQRVLDKHKDFAGLFLFICLLDSQNIPRGLLEAFKNEGVIDKFIYYLKKYSLITNESAGSSLAEFNFSTHRSTQEIILTHLIKALDLQNKRELLNSISHVLEKYTEDAIDKEDFSRMESLMRHCKVFLSHKNLVKGMIRGSLGSKLGGVYYYLGYYSEAKEILEEALVSLNKCYDEHYLETARILGYLGNIYREFGEYEKAKEFLERSVKIYKILFGIDDIKTSWALANLGILYRNLGDYQKSKTLLEQSRKIYKLQFGENHLKTTWVSVHLGNVYRELGHYGAAKNLLERNHNIYREYFPENLIGLAWVLIHLSNVHRELGNFEIAKNMLEQSYKIYKDHFGNDHLDVACALGRLGNVHKELGHYEIAKNLLDESHRIYKKNFDNNHLKIGWVSIYLGNYYKKINDFEKGKDFLKKGLSIYEKHYGKDHIETARILRSLGEIYFLEGHLEAGEDAIRYALNIFSRNAHPESYTCLEILAELNLRRSLDLEKIKNMNKSKDFKQQAVQDLRQALAIIKTHFPKDSTSFVRIQRKLGTIK